MLNSSEESYLKERISREDAQQEFYAEISQRLGDKELFVLLHLINRHAAYVQMMDAMSKGVERDAILADIDDADTIANISSATRIHHQFVRTIIYALSLIGLVEKAGMKINASSWRVTRAGGQVVKKAMEMEDKRKKNLEQRFSEQTKKKN